MAEVIWKLLPYYKTLGNLWLFEVGLKSISCFVSKWEHFEKRGAEKGSRAHEKGQFFSNFEFPRKMTDFAGLFWSDHLTFNNSPGISGKKISISFIWNPVFRNRASGEAAVTSGKSGLMCSAFKMLISVLSNKAVLDSIKSHGVTTTLTKLCHCNKMHLRT